MDHALCAGQASTMTGSMRLVLAFIAVMYKDGARSVKLASHAYLWHSRGYKIPFRWFEGMYCLWLFLHLFADGERGIYHL